MPNFNLTPEPETTPYLERTTVFHLEIFSRSCFLNLKLNFDLKFEFLVYFKQTKDQIPTPFFFSFFLFRRPRGPSEKPSHGRIYFRKTASSWLYNIPPIDKNSFQTFHPKKELRAIKRVTHGGVSLKKRRKVKRPLIPGLITHVVLKSSKAKADLSFYKHKKLVNQLLKEKSKKFFIEILDWVNMGNHLHLKVRFKDSKRMGQFLKSFTALLARRITGAKKGKRFGKFWDGLAYTRVLISKFEELGLQGYFEGNHREKELGPEEREQYLKRFNQWIYRLKQARAKSQSPPP